MLSYNFDEKANDVINYAFSEARDLGHRFVGTEHLLLGLSHIKGSKITETFTYYRVTTKDIRLELIKLIGNSSTIDGIEDYTYRAKECLKRSFDYAIASNNAEIMPEHIFMSILADKQSIGYKVLTKLSLDLVKLSSEYATEPLNEKHLIKGDSPTARTVKLLDFDQDYSEKEEKILSIVGRDLTEWVKDAPYEEIVGREGEIDRMIQILTRRKKNNPCLIGEPGVGKTAIVTGLARRIIEKNVPESLKATKIIEINIGALVSGTMYRGQFESRMKEIIDALKETPGKYIAFFDEIQNLVGAGATGDKSMDAFSMLKPYLAEGSIQIIGATTYQDYRKFIEPDQAVSRRLMLIDVDEPTEEETESILNKIKVHYEVHHHVVITPKAVKSAIDLSMRYLPERKLPDKAIDIIDEACSRKRSDNLKMIEIVEELKYRLAELKLEKETLILAMKFDEAAKIQKEEKRILTHIEKNDSAHALMTAQKLVVDQSDIERIISDWAKVPVNQLSTQDKKRLADIEHTLEERIFGQSQAIQSISKALKRFRLGIKEPQRPMGSFLFVGPTGVGKTELAKAIAEIYFGSERHLIKIDMSEYMEKHTLSKLIGSPPGYEGTKEGGYLTNEVSKMPYALVVFDEIEKAHYDVINVLLQIMDEGILTDGRGKRVSFKNTLIVMTSNLGSDTQFEKKMGFSFDSANVQEAVKIREACKAYFKPEFINRIDEIIVFNKLEKDALAQIVASELKKLEKLLSEKDISMTYDEAIVHFIVEKGFDAQYGARPIRRAIDTWVKDLIAQYFIECDEDVLNVHLEIENDEIRINEVEYGKN